MPPPRVPADKRSIFSTKKTVTARIVAVTFQQDHRDPADVSKKLLKRSKTEPITVEWLNQGSQTTVTKSISSMYGDTFDEFPKPEWDETRGDGDCSPVSYTKGSSVVVDVDIQFTVTPARQSAKLTKVKGASDDFLTFEKDLTLTVTTGRITVPGLVSSGTLPNQVDLIDFRRIAWSVVIDGKSMDIGETGNHTIYVTFGTPGGSMASQTLPMTRMDFPSMPPQPVSTFTETGQTQVVTEQRLRFSLLAALKKGQADEKECVDAVFKRLLDLNVGYILSRRWSNDTHVVPQPTLHHYLWLCNTANGQGECHNIAAAFALACRILGVQGAFEVGYMFPLPSRQATAPDYPKIPNALMGRYSPNPGDAYWRTHPGEHHGWENLMFLDSNAFVNNFEGVARYKEVLYAIGDAIFDLYNDRQKNASSYFANRGANSSTNRPTNVDMTRGWPRGGNPPHWPLVFDACTKPYPSITSVHHFSQPPNGWILNVADFAWEQ